VLLFPLNLGKNYSGIYGQVGFITPLGSVFDDLDDWAHLKNVSSLIHLDYLVVHFDGSSLASGLLGCFWFEGGEQRSAVATCFGDLSWLELNKSSRSLFFSVSAWLTVIIPAFDCLVSLGSVNRSLWLNLWPCFKVAWSQYGMWKLFATG
jgi:hypothetical protein